MGEEQIKNELSATTDKSIIKEKGDKTNKGFLIGVITLSILAIGGISFGIYELTQNNNKSAEIETLKNTISQQNQEHQNEKSSEDTLLEIITNEEDTKKEASETNNADIEKEASETNNNQNETATSEIIGKFLLFNRKLSNAKKQRYELVYVSGGERTAFNNISSEDDSYYILDTQKLGSTEDLKAFDLVSVIKPLTEQKIKNGMPEYAIFNIYSNDDKLYLSQCESFTVEYLDGHDYLAMTIGFDLNTDIPIAVNYSCHYNNDTTRRLYHRAIYNLNAETGEIKELEQFSTSDFANK